MRFLLVLLLSVSGWAQCRPEFCQVDQAGANPALNYCVGYSRGISRDGDKPPRKVIGEYFEIADVRRCNPENITAKEDSLLGFIVLSGSLIRSAKYPLELDLTNGEKNKLRKKGKLKETDKPSKKVKK